MSWLAAIDLGVSRCREGFGEAPDSKITGSIAEPPCGAEPLKVLMR